MPFQQVVTCEVAKVVVDLFEQIEVEKEKGERAPGVSDVCLLGGKRVEEVVKMSTICKSCQFVGQ